MRVAVQAGCICILCEDFAWVGLFGPPHANDRPRAGFCSPMSNGFMLEGLQDGVCKDDSVIGRTRAVVAGC